MTVREISQAVDIMEKDVYHHLSFIEKTVRYQKRRIHLDPYYCLDCEFQFKNRRKFKKPGKCPGFKDGRIAPAVFQIVTQSGSLPRNGRIALKDRSLPHAACDSLPSRQDQS